MAKCGAGIEWSVTYDTRGVYYASELTDGTQKLHTLERTNFEGEAQRTELNLISCYACILASGRFDTENCVNA